MTKITQYKQSPLYHKGQEQRLMPVKDTDEEDTVRKKETLEHRHQFEKLIH